jgi:hypothetical protein
MIARRFLLMVLGLVAVSGCDRRRNPDDPYGREVADAIPEIEKATGLKFKTPPRLEMRSREEVRAFLLKKFNEDMPSEQLRGDEVAYKAMGFIPDTLDLRAFLLDLLTEQIVGYYDPATKVLYIVRDAPEDLAGVTVSHELIHALQDQHLNLDSLQKSKDDSDHKAAVQAVLEGQATWIHMKMALGGADMAQRIPGGWEQLRQQIRESQAAMPKFSNAPMAIQESLIFPYLSGAEFVRRFSTRGDTRSPLSALPVSTEQILSEEAFFGATPDVPTSVRLPGTPRIGEYDETMGEFGTRLFLFQHSKNNQSAIAGAHGWDGDRYRVSGIGKTRRVVWASVWDTPLDAAEFVDALGEGVLRRYRAGAPSSGARGMRTYMGAGRTVIVTHREIGGRSVVVYVDVPTGQPTSIVDVDRITLGRQ